MTNEQINIAIAEACGWTDTEIINEGGKLMYGQTEVPNYCGDLNAMHDAEKTMVFSERKKFVCELQKAIGRQFALGAMVWLDACIHATAQQRAEAFLRTIEKWEEGK